MDSGGLQIIKVKMEKFSSINKYELFYRNDEKGNSVYLYGTQEVIIN